MLKAVKKNKNRLSVQLDWKNTGLNKVTQVFLLFLKLLTLSQMSPTPPAGFSYIGFSTAELFRAFKMLLLCDMDHEGGRWPHLSISFISRIRGRIAIGVGF